MVKANGKRKKTKGNKKIRKYQEGREQLDLDPEDGKLSTEN